MRFLLTRKPACMDTRICTYTCTLTHTQSSVKIKNTPTIIVKTGNCWIADQTLLSWTGDCFQSRSTFPWYHTGRNPVQYDYVGWSLFGSQAKSLCPVSDLKYDHMLHALFIKLSALNCDSWLMGLELEFLFQCFQLLCGVLNTWVKNTLCSLSVLVYHVRS